MPKPSTFWSRNRRVILQTFFIVLVAGTLITLFQMPIYQATATIEGPPAADPAAQAKALEAPDLIRESLASMGLGSTTKLPFVNVRAIDFGPLMPGRFALIAESDDPQFVSALATAWANTVVSDSSGQAKVVLPAETPQIPIRPKKGQSLLLSAFLGIILGVIFGCIRDARRSSFVESTASMPSTPG